MIYIEKALDVLRRDAIDTEREAMWRYGVRHAIGIIEMAIASQITCIPSGNADARSIGLDWCITHDSRWILDYPECDARR